MHRLRQTPPDYPKRIKALRGKLGLTQTRLASLLGIAPASVDRWEKGQGRPSASSWKLIAEAETLGLDAFRPKHPDKARASTGEILQETYSPVTIDFQADPTKVWVVTEAERLSFGHLFNPAFATETSVIDPLPHQRIAVYERMLLQPRLRFLLADDAGAGKTIMTGLYIREMISRRLIRRVLIAPPAGLLGNWWREMNFLFDLPFRIVRGSEAADENPFVGPESNLVVVSIDTLASDRVFSRLQGTEVSPYDLVVFDEAHKLSAFRDADMKIRKTDRYKVAEALVGAGDADTLVILHANTPTSLCGAYWNLWPSRPQMRSAYILRRNDISTSSDEPKKKCASSMIAQCSPSESRIL